MLLHADIQNNNMTTIKTRHKPTIQGDNVFSVNRFEANKHVLTPFYHLFLTSQETI